MLQNGCCSDKNLYYCILINVRTKVHLQTYQYAFDTNHTPKVAMIFYKFELRLNLYFIAALLILPSVTLY